MRDRTVRTISMNQCKYVVNVLKKFGMEDCNLVGIPLDVNFKFVKLTEEENTLEAQSMIELPYKQAVGSLMYDMIATRSDFAYAISCVGQHMVRLGSMHWVAVSQ